MSRLRRSPEGPAHRPNSCSRPFRSPPHIASPRLLETRLLQDTIQSSGREIVRRLARHGDAAGLRWVLILAMTTARRNQNPAVLLEHLYRVTDLHAPGL